ncbi:hypothetical protein [Eubacterium oxidoreducens]|uniref:Uncharacterized protein n=1 Tax=Eubacterium oxidoreducens TaxID=1732 RepID=A0A1G6BIJ4_EUBOX|nr:hypothetical protein [Eubacterium oxidoreducens]SDB20441.1 hypothetical protein SAMN02910417_01559 [Eubacterium oxidoreducens]
MKKKIVIFIVVALALIVVAIGIYSSPKTFGGNIDASEVDHIKVFDGNTGVEFTIDNAEDIRFIVENIKDCTMKRTGISIGYSGYGFRINYMDAGDKNVISEFIMNSSDTIRKDPFFYSCDGELCYEFLRKMEETYGAD